jgi:hypothetical protein
MEIMKKGIWILLILLLLSLPACTRYHTKGPAVGGSTGGVTGTILDHKNPWRGGVAGAAPGTIAGATLADISYRGSREAIRSGRPVEYTTEDGRGKYHAEPMDYSAGTNCRKVHERVWADGRLVKDQLRDICQGTKYERRY